MLLKSKIQSSFAFKLTFWVSIVTAIVFLATICIIYHVSRATIVENLKDNSTLSMKNAVYEIEKKFESISKTVDNIALLVEQETLPLDSLYSITKYVVGRNSDIVGSAIAFEPYYHKRNEYYYSPYAYRAGESILTKQLGTTSYDYFSMDWYSLPKEIKHGNWTSPYFDEGGGSYLMCTYSSPMYNKNGAFIGVVTADVSLIQVAELVSSLRPTEDSYSFAVYKDGSFFYKDQYFDVDHHSIFNSSSVLGSSKDKAAIVNEMIEGKTGSHDINRRSQIYYAPISGVGWSLGMVIDKAYLYHDLQDSSTRIAIVALLGILLVFFVCRRIIRVQIKPLTQFSKIAKEIARGRFDVEPPTIRTKDEMRELRNSFVYLQEELVRYMDSLKQTIVANEKIESELQIARSIQMSLIPKSFPSFPKRKDVDLSALLRPAKQVGGDLYDFFIESNKLYFCIGDVSDKGIPAAIFMALTRSQFRSFASSADNAQEIVENMNKSASENNDANMFVTLIVGILDMATGEIEYCNAGHNNPCIISEGISEFVSMSPSLPIGIIPTAAYKNEYLSLSAGQTLLLYTDGVNEAENNIKKQFGNERLLKSISNTACNGSKGVISALISSVDSFVSGATQSDDLTILAIKYTGNKQDKLLVLKNDITEINKMNRWLESILDIDENSMKQINLALEEAVTNVIMYAYPMDGKEYELAVRYSKNGDEHCFEIEDQGKAFDPTQKEDADVTLGAQERQIGGLGIFLVKQIMDSVEYCRKDDYNVLTMKKAI